MAVTKLIANKIANQPYYAASKSLGPGVRNQYDLPINAMSFAMQVNELPGHHRLLSTLFPRVKLVLCELQKRKALENIGSQHLTQLSSGRCFASPSPKEGRHS